MQKMSLLWIFVIIILISACSSAIQGQSVNIDDAVQAGVEATLTKEAWLSGVESARKTAIAEESQSPAGDGEDSNQTNAPSSTPTPSLTPTLQQVTEHYLVPGEPKEGIDSFLLDYNSIDSAPERVTYGDQFKNNIFERPFTSEIMDYRGEIDIIRVNLKTSETWFYFDIYLAVDLPDKGEMNYGLELDLDENGRGDYLIESELPLSKKWSVDGVKVYRDLNKDVGGKSPFFSDDLDESLNGYEVLIFDQGDGDDPDLAWVRRHPDESNIIQIAIKYYLTGPSGYMWSVWADDGLKAPDYFDYSDRFTAESAGNPYPGSPLYPIKGLELVDSTCRSWYGFTPTGNEPGLCPN
jgi:hypothetical protein